MMDREQKIIGNMNLVHYIVHKHFPQYTANSMYSTTANVSEICKKHGGGGHCHAAGFVCSELPF